MTIPDPFLIFLASSRVISCPIDLKLSKISVIPFSSSLIVRVSPVQLLTELQANNIAKAMDLYLEDNSNKDKLKEANSLYNSMYQQLVKDCGKI